VEFLRRSGPGSCDLSRDQHGATAVGCLEWKMALPVVLQGWFPHQQQQQQLFRDAGSQALWPSY